MGKKDKADPAELPKLSKKEYEAEMTRLHGELVKLQYWVRMTGQRII